MKKSDELIVTGQIVRDNSNSKFTVDLDEKYGGLTITCTPAGKLMHNRIRVMVGDKVEIRLSVYDPTVGMITRRIDSKNQSDAYKGNIKMKNKKK